MKRFTETLKWCDPWFSELDSKHKLLWLWMLDHCDAAGVFEIGWKKASFDIGFECKNSDLDFFSSKIQRLPSGKILINKFIAFQCPGLSELCKPHNPVFESLDKNNLTVRYSEGIGKVIFTIPKGIGNLQEKNKNPYKDKDSDPF